MVSCYIFLNLSIIAAKYWLKSKIKCTCCGQFSCCFLDSQYNRKRRAFLGTPLIRHFNFSLFNKGSISCFRSRLHETVWGNRNRVFSKSLLHMYIFLSISASIHLHSSICLLVYINCITFIFHFCLPEMLPCLVSSSHSPSSSWNISHLFPSSTLIFLIVTCCRVVFFLYE